MKRLLCIIALMFSLACMLTSCSDNEPTVSVNDDSFVVVNGVTTNIVADKDDVVTVDDDGFVIVNGTKTEYKIDQGSEGCTHNFGANGICNICNAADPNKIEYSVNFGTKIDTLSIFEQEMIDAYVADCKTLYKAAYTPTALDTRMDLVPYISFTDVIVYDFRNVDESTLDSKSLTLWDILKNFYPESRPMMYVELAGYHAYFDSDLLTPIQSGAIIYGFFIFEDETVIRQTYNRLGITVYVYKLFEGTTVINCGNKYSEEFNEQKFNAWINSTGEYKSLQDMMQKLRVDE